MLVPIRMGTNVAAGDKQKHLLLSYAAYKSVNLINTRGTKKH